MYWIGLTSWWQVPMWQAFYVCVVPWLQPAHDADIAVRCSGRPQLTVLCALPIISPLVYRRASSSNFDNNQEQGHDTTITAQLRGAWLRRAGDCHRWLQNWPFFQPPAIISFWTSTQFCEACRWLSHQIGTVHGRQSKEPDQPVWQQIGIHVFDREYRALR